MAGIKYPVVRVYLTKEYKFCAIIQEDAESKPYSVVVNSDKWNRGKGSQHKAKVMAACKKILEKIQENLK